MEPFIIEEELASLLLIIGCGVLTYYVVKYAFKLLEWYLSKPKKAEEPKDKIKRVIAESETKLEMLGAKISDLELKHTRFEAEVVIVERDLAKWKHLETAAMETGKEEDIRKAVRRRMEAEDRLKLVKTAENDSRNAIDDIEEKCEELRHKIELVRSAQATLETRMEAAKIRQDLADDFKDSPDAVIEELENATIESESRAEAYEETSRFHRNAQAAKISEDDVSAEISKRRSGRKPKEQNNG